MNTIPWISSSWSDTLQENTESFYLDSLYPASGQPLLHDERLPYSRWSEKNVFFIIIGVINIFIGRAKVYQMGMTKGDKLFFNGAESFCEISGRSKTLRLNDSSAATASLKRKLDSVAPVSSPLISKHIRLE